MKRWLVALGRAILLRGSPGPGGLGMMAMLVGLLAFAACAAEEKASPTPAAPTAAAKPSPEEEWNRVVEAAKKEGKVVVAGPRSAPVRKGLSEPFEKRFGISVEYQGMSGVELASRVKAERTAGQYLWDVYIGAITAAVSDYKPIGGLDPLEPALILPEATDPKSWFGNALAFADKDRMLLQMLSYATEAFGINTKLMKADEIKSYKDFLDPKWKGKILIDDPRVGGPGQSKFHLFYVHKDLGASFIRALAEQKPVLLRDREQALRWLAEGRYPVLLGVSKASIISMKEAGAPIDLVPPQQMKEGGSLHMGTGGVALFNKAPHPSAAKVYINWLLTKEGQTEFSRAIELPSRRLDVPKDMAEPWELPVQGFLSLDTEEAHKARDDVAKLATELFGN